MVRITKLELDDKIAHAEDAALGEDGGEIDSIGISKERFEEYRLLVDHNVELIDRLDHHSWTRTSRMTAYNMADRIQQIVRGGPKKEVHVMMPPKLYVDLLKAVRRHLYGSRR